MDAEGESAASGDSISGTAGSDDDAAAAPPDGARRWSSEAPGSGAEEWSKPLGALGPPGADGCTTGISLASDENSSAPPSVSADGPAPASAGWSDDCAAAASTTANASRRVAAPTPSAPTPACGRARTGAGAEARRRLSSVTAARCTGAAGAPSSMAIVPDGAPSSTRCPMLPSSAGTTRVGSEARKAGRIAVGATSEICRCSGGRNAHPAGGTIRSARDGTPPAVAETRGAASVIRSSDRCHGHRTSQPPSLIRVLIAAISRT